MPRKPKTSTNGRVHPTLLPEPKDAITTVFGDPEVDLAAQEAYEQRHGQRNLSVLIGRAFVLGMRKNGYKNTATALDEFFDNALQAGASRVDVLFGFSPSDAVHPGQIAVIDNGHGMKPGMIRLAMLWGGSHRAEHDDRSGFGRFGFGLPTAALSQGEEYTVISRTSASEPFYAVHFDTRKLGSYASENGGALEIPPYERIKLPAWLQKDVDEKFDGLPHGTIILLGALDNLSWRKRETLQRELKWHFGLYYRNFLAICQMYVHGEEVVPIDPLFLTEGALYYDFDKQRANALDRLTISVKDPITGEEQGPVTVRFSYMPYGFAGVENEEPTTDGKSRRIKPNPRFAILKQNPGIVVLRHGRQIDVVDIPKRSEGWWEFIHRDYHWGCEIDFPAALDEEFNVTTSKQGVKPTPRMWQYINEHVRPIIHKMRRDREAERQLKKSPAPMPEEAAEQIVADVAAKWRRKPLGNDPERIQKAIENLEREVSRRSKETGVPEKDVAEAMVAQIKKRPFKVQRISEPEGAFYRVEPLPGQAILLLNTAHPFYNDVYYPAPDAVKAAFLLVLGAFSMAEASAPPEYYKLYVRERSVWSEKLTDLLEELKSFRWDELESDAIDEIGGVEPEVQTEIGEILKNGLA